MNIFEMALKQMEREGRNPSDKNYGIIWERRVYKINNYLMKIQGNEARKK